MNQNQGTVSSNGLRYGAHGKPNRLTVTFLRLCFSCTKLHFYVPKYLKNWSINANKIKTFTFIFKLYRKLSKNLLFNNNNTFAYQCHKSRLYWLDDIYYAYILKMLFSLQMAEGSRLTMRGRPGYSPLFLFYPSLLLLLFYRSRSWSVFFPWYLQKSNIFLYLRIQGYSIWWTQFCTVIFS